MSKQQVVARTYPNDCVSSTKQLKEYLSMGYYVVMCNKFNIDDRTFCNEYILEKEEKRK